MAVSLRVPDSLSAAEGRDEGGWEGLCLHLECRPPPNPGPSTSGKLQLGHGLLQKPRSSPRL